MNDVFAIGDTHFKHTNILKFLHNDKPLRPFSSIEEMEQTIEDNWNKVVTPRDKVYHVGDVAFHKSGLSILNRLNGKKRLVRGNHDLFRTLEYLKYFDEVYGVRQLSGIWLTHCPMHITGVEQERVKLNVHGHLHANVIDHPKYVNVCVENTNYTPVSLEQLAFEKGIKWR